MWGCIGCRARDKIIIPFMSYLPVKTFVPPEWGNQKGWMGWMGWLGWVGNGGWLDAAVYV